MRPLAIFAASALALTLAACGNDQSDAPAQTTEDISPMEMPASDMMDHSSHAEGDDGMGHGVGVIMAVSPQNDSVIIDHGPIDGVGMGAMTMSFGTMGTIDLSGFSEGDAVAFMVKRGRDNSYRISAICDTAAEGDNCLEAMMDH